MEISIEIENKKLVPFPKGFRLCWVVAIAWITGEYVHFDGVQYRSYDFWKMITIMCNINTTEIRLTPWDKTRLVESLIAKV